MRILRKHFTLVALAAIGLSTMARADTITMNFNNSFSDGGAPPQGSAPWLVAVFQDTTTNHVSLTLTAPNLTTNKGNIENAEAWYFNSTTALTIAHTGGTATYTGAAAFSVDAYKADGDGWYDFVLNFQTGDSGFTQGETATFDLTGTGLTAANFLSQSNPLGGGSTPYYAAAHIQSTGANGNGSAWVAPQVSSVPNEEPPPVVPLPPGAWAGTCLLGLLGITRWRHERAL